MIIRIETLGNSELFNINVLWEWEELWMNWVQSHDLAVEYVHRLTDKKEFLVNEGESEFIERWSVEDSAPWIEPMADDGSQPVEIIKEEITIQPAPIPKSDDFDYYSIMFDEDTNGDPSNVIVASKKAEPKDIVTILQAEEDDLDGRSPFFWVRTSGGTLMLCVMPLGDTYCAVEDCDC